MRRQNRIFYHILNIDAGFLLEKILEGKTIDHCFLSNRLLLLFNTYSMRQPDLYYFETIKITSQAQSNENTSRRRVFSVNF